MKALTALRALGPIDLKSVGRDSLLSWMIAIPLIVALLLRWLVPQITVWLATGFNFALEPYYPLLMSYFILLSPIMAGMVIGFLLLDERDDRTLIALQVTPLSLTGYLLYRIIAPIILSVIITLIAFPIVNLVSLPFISLLAAILLASLEAPLFALFLASFAENKVAGFALMKASSVLLVIAVAAYFIRPPWQLLIGIIPPYWPAKLCWIAYEGSPGFWIYFLGGVLVHLGFLAMLLKRFNRAMHS
jgi:fluoroquinolone transport system permease protein